MCPSRFSLYHLQAHGAVFFQDDDVVGNAFQILAVTLYRLASFVVNNSVGNLLKHFIFAKTSLKSGCYVRFVRFGHIVQPAPPFFINVDAGAIVKLDYWVIRIAQVKPTISFKQLKGTNISIIARAFIKLSHFVNQISLGDAAFISQIFAQLTQFVQFLIKGIVKSIAVIQGIRTHMNDNRITVIPCIFVCNHIIMTMMVKHIRCSGLCR